jgi:hypothetical protein
MLFTYQTSLGANIGPERDCCHGCCELNIDPQLRACENWCESYTKCSFCAESRTCGSGYVSIEGETFAGTEKIYYACEKVGSINRIWPGTTVAEALHRVLVVAVGGSSGSIRDEGMEWFCEDFFGGAKRVPAVLCISSYAMPSTRSRQLADNIADLAQEIQRLNGAEPIIVLIGKSMGGCKLHHAAAGKKGGKYGDLKDKEIDLFVGVDPSCSLGRHFEGGLDDGLEFKRNVNTLLIFYQEKEGEAQTGHVGYFEGENFDENRHIDVNNEAFDIGEERKAITEHSDYMCDNVGHGEMDDCEAVKTTLRRLILKRAGLSY